MEYLETLLDTVSSVEFGSAAFLKQMAIACGAALLLSLLARGILGKRSSLNHAISSAIGILAVYILGIALYGGSTLLSGLLSSLPFVAVRDGSVALFSFASASVQDICAVLIRMVVLAFLVNLLDTLLPRGKNFFAWLLLRLLTVFLAVLCQYLIIWLSARYLPAAFLTWAPTILLGILVVMLLLGALKILVGLALASVNPVIGALYTFFFATLVGKQLSKAVLTTLLLSLLVYALTSAGYVVISLIGISLPLMAAVFLVLLALWYLVHQVL